MDKMVAYVIFGIIAIILVLNVFKVIKNMFRREEIKQEHEENVLRQEIRGEVDSEVKPYLTSLEGMYEKSETDAPSFSVFVFNLVKDKFSKHIEKNPKLLEDEIGHCCDEYADADCKESFCLEGSGINCPKV